MNTDHGRSIEVKKHDGVIVTFSFVGSRIFKVDRTSGVLTRLSCVLPYELRWSAILVPLEVDGKCIQIKIYMEDAPAQIFEVQSESTHCAPYLE